MTFEEMYTSYYGEKLDRIEQLSVIQFTGEELKSFVEHCIQQKLNIASVVRPEVEGAKEGELLPASDGEANKRADFPLCDYVSGLPCTCKEGDHCKIIRA